MELIDNGEEEVAKPDEASRESAANDGLGSRHITTF